jgi:hypothetical protein
MEGKLLTAVPKDWIQNEADCRQLEPRLPLLLLWPLHG